jgi:hypothetical protein
MQKEIRSEKKRSKELERKRLRKERAIIETAALLTLRKNAGDLWKADQCPGSPERLPPEKTGIIENEVNFHIADYDMGNSCAGSKRQNRTGAASGGVDSRGS